MKYLIPIAIILMSNLIACKKQSHDTVSPTITVVEPMLNDTLSLSDDPEIHIEFTTTDASGLNDLKVTLSKNNNSIIYDQSPAIHNLKVFEFHDHFIPTGISIVTPIQLAISSTDIDGNNETKKLNFYLKP